MTQGRVLLVLRVCVLAEHPVAQGRGGLDIPLGLDLYLPVPEENPLSPERVTLGRTLFVDPILSRKKIEPEPTQLGYVVSVLGVGYRFEAGGADMKTS